MGYSIECRAMVLGLLFGLAAAAVPAAAQVPINIEQALNTLSTEATVLAGLDLEGRFVIFQKSGVGSVSGNQVALEEGAFTLQHVVSEPSPDGLERIMVLDVLMDLWEKWKEDPPETEDFAERMEINGQLYEFTGLAILLKGTATIQLKDILQSR